MVYLAGLQDHLQNVSPSSSRRGLLGLKEQVVAWDGKMQTIIVTGGAGFIGSNFARIALRKKDWRLVVIDKLTYAGSHLNLSEIADDPRYSFIHADIADQAAMTEAFERWHPEIDCEFRRRDACRSVHRRTS